LYKGHMPLLDGPHARLRIVTAPPLRYLLHMYIHAHGCSLGQLQRLCAHRVCNG
jgi:hypothetical protein